MEVVILDEPTQLTHVAADALAGLLAGAPDATLGLATGPSPLAALIRQVPALVDHVTDGDLLEIHLDGPRLSARRCGAHEPTALRDPDPARSRPGSGRGRGRFAW